MQPLSTRRTKIAGVNDALVGHFHSTKILRFELVTVKNTLAYYITLVKSFIVQSPSNRKVEKSQFIRTTFLAVFSSLETAALIQSNCFALSMKRSNLKLKFRQKLGCRPLNVALTGANVVKLFTAVSYKFL
jgi:hypothetical protein